MTLRITIDEQSFVLHQSGAVYWEGQQTLLISDVHLGKVAHFRKHGIAIPNQAIFENFLRLNAVLDFFKPQRIIFLGDLFHSKLNNEWRLFADWVKATQIEIILVEGNHDIISKEKYSELNIRTFPSLLIDDFLLTHHPEAEDGFFNFCGHIHPGINLRGSGRQSLSLPCFFRRKNQMILPAFGEFTGNFYLMPMENDIIYAITNEAVILIPGS